MKKMIQQMTDIETNEKQRLNEEAITECGDVGMASNGMPPSMNINLTASGKENIDELLSMMRAAGLSNAGEVGPSQMPMRQDMDRLRAITADPHEMEADEAYADEFEDAEYDNSPDEEYMDQPEGGGINRKKGAYTDAEDGDNPMAVKIKEQLLKALSDKKAKK